MCDCASLPSVVEDTAAGIMCCVKVCLQRRYCANGPHRAQNKVTFFIMSGDVIFRNIYIYEFPPPFLIQIELAFQEGQN